LSVHSLGLTSFYIPYFHYHLLSVYDVTVALSLKKEHQTSFIVFAK